jgi:hypothetical protein
MGWASFWAIILQTHPVTLWRNALKQAVFGALTVFVMQLVKLLWDVLPHMMLGSFRLFCENTNAWQFPETIVTLKVATTKRIHHHNAA